MDKDENRICIGKVLAILFKFGLELEFPPRYCAVLLNFPVRADVVVSMVTARTPGRRRAATSILISFRIVGAVDEIKCSYKRTKCFSFLTN